MDLGSRSEDTRTAILDGAIRVFARLGFEAASTRAIAVEAGVHHASLRYHFDDKGELWRAAVRHMFERQRAEFRADQAANPVDTETTGGVREMVRRYVRYSAAHPEHAQMLVHEAIADGERLDWLVEQFVRANIQRLGLGLERERSAGRLRLADATLTAIVLSAASQMIFVLRPHLKRVFHTDVHEPAFVARLADAMVDLLFLDAPPP